MITWDVPGPIVKYIPPPKSFALLPIKIQSLTLTLYEWNVEPKTIPSPPPLPLILILRIFQLLTVAHHHWEMQNC